MRLTRLGGFGLEADRIDPDFAKVRDAHFAGQVLVQPDVCAAGGFTVCRRIAALAMAHGVQVNPHVWGSSVGQVASLQLACALPHANSSLHAEEPVFEYDCSSHPFREHLADRPLRQRGAWLGRPEGPGLGLEVDRGALERYRA